MPDLATNKPGQTTTKPELAPLVGGFDFTKDGRQIATALRDTRARTPGRPLAKRCSTCGRGGRPPGWTST